MTNIHVVTSSSGEVLQVGPALVRVLEDGSRTDQRLGAVTVTVPAHTPPLPQHLHRMHDETFLVLSGTLRFSVGGTDHDLHPGDYVVAPVGAPHTFSNPFEGTAVFFNSFTPAYYVNYFRDLGNALDVHGSSPEEILRVMARYATAPAATASS